MAFPGDTLDERFLRSSIRVGSTSGGPAWNEASSIYQQLLWYYLNWPPNTCTNPPVRLYCGLTGEEVLKLNSQLTGLERNDAESTFDYLGRMLMTGV